MDQSIETARQRIEGLVNPIENLIQRAPLEPRLNNISSVTRDSNRQLLIETVRDLPQISSIIIGYDNGNFYQIGATRHRPESYLKSISAPENTIFLEKIITHSTNGGKLVVDRYLGTDGKTIDARTSNASKYDPCKRPWFIAASTTNSVARTNVYLFSSTGKPGITISKRFKTGVIGIDITLKELNKFLAKAPQSKDGALLITQGDGTILARSWGQQNQTEKAGEINFEELSSVLTEQNATGGPGQINFNGQQWMFREAPIRLGAEPHEKIIIAMPVAVITSQINKLSKQTLLISLLILLGSIPIIWLISRSISKPILSLVDDVNRIKGFDLDAKISATSFIHEIHSLETAMEQTRVNLKTFSLYVPKALVRQLVASGHSPQLGGELREVTILFMDIENFTAMTAHLSPEETMARMSSYFEKVTKILLAHDATIDKYIGDAVMAFWNAPNDQPDHARTACKAALELIKVANAETDQWDVAKNLKIRSRIGIHCGDAIIGNVGSSDRMNYTALGATVNLASRLEGLNKELGTDILISSNMANKVSDRFELVSVENAALKGFDDPVTVYELRGEK
ncbi:MAG: hypothetical protein JKY83_04640 [Rhizobiaceae bacterium]|nr:hypothetical protein [Rhizobiaceae bacterium]